MTGRERPLHLLEFGLRWPPETFIAAKLEALAVRGVRITVASLDIRLRPVHTIDGVRVEYVVPAGRTSKASLVAAVARLVLTRPCRLRAVVRAAFEPTGEGRILRRREALGRLRTYARLACLRPDVVQFEWCTAAVHFRSLVDALGCPSVVSVRGGDLELYPYGPATSGLAAAIPDAFRRAAAVHCVSNATRGEARALGLRPEKARVIRPAVNLALFQTQPPRSPDGAFHVLGVGWLHWRKGWEYSLQAIAHLAGNGIPIVFDIVSPEPASDMSASSDGERIRRAIDDLGLGDRITWHGSVEHAQVRSLLAKADALLHSSLAEGIPNVVLEAMAYGIPVVATDVGGTREVLDDGVQGFLVPPRDSGAAADALAALWRDPDLRIRLGKAGRARAERELNLELQTDRWLELYADVVRRPTGRPGLRIAEIGLDWPPEAFLRRKLQGLAERGAEIVVASIVQPGERPTPIEGIRLDRLPHWAERLDRVVLGMAGDGVRLLVSDPRRLRVLLREWRALAPGLLERGRRLSLLRLHLHLARLGADVAHFEWISFAETCSPLFRVWSFPVVVSCHGSEVLVEGSTDLLALFSRVDGVHAVSRAVEHAAAARGLAGSGARVIPSAVDPDVFRPPNNERPRDGRFLIVTVGALRWVKGYEYALAAIRRLVDRGVPVEYEMVGSEPRGSTGELRRILAVVDDLNLSGHVRLRGRLAERLVVETLQRCDAFLQASLSEGMPTAVLEAMACGVPVVATDVGGTREALTDGVEGLLVPPRDPKQLADALGRLWEDPALRVELGRAGRDRIQAGLTLDDQLDRFEALYGELVAT